MSCNFKKLPLFVASVSMVFALSACNGSNSTEALASSDTGSSATGNTSPTTGTTSTLPDTSSIAANNPSAPVAPAPAPAPTGTPAPTPSKPARSYTTDVLLFAGDGAWSAEVSALQDIMKSHGTTYQAVSSAQLDAMSVDDMAKFGLIIFPGGSGGTEAESLSADTHARLRSAVQERGVSYLGFCAGSFIAVAPAPAAGKDVSYGLGVVAGPELDYYYLENQGTDIAMTMQTFADGTKRDILWYGGPVTPSTPGSVIAKYPNGDAAISEMWSGKGFVILSGGHPTATDAVKSSLGVNDSDGSDQDIAWNLLNAALKQAPLPAFSS